MDPTLLVALLAALISLLLLGATLLLVASVVVFVWRSRRKAARGAPVARAEAPPDPIPDASPDRPAPPARAARSVPPAPPGAGAASSGPLPLQGGGLLGFFDDESSAPGQDAHKTELFKPIRGERSEDVSEEGEATEIFSAHGAAAELAEFAFDEADDAAGRMSKASDRR